VGFDELSPVEQWYLTASGLDCDAYGLLRPANGLLPPKLVSKEAALLLLTLQRPQRIPLLIASIFGDDPSPLSALVADGVLEVEHDGVFVSGGAALRLVAPQAAPIASPERGLATAAIEYAASYEGLDAVSLAQRIYLFGRRPCTPERRRRFATDADLLSFLCADSDIPNLLSSAWTFDTESDGSWLVWSTGSRSARLTHKLYISPQFEVMPRLFAATVRALVRAECEHFKVGRGGDGVCRPDKMVAYFASLEQLHACATLIEADLATSDLSAASSQGVPFTAGIDRSGFLSWGMDPPKLLSSIGSHEFQSWRGWISWRVAIAVLSARGTADERDIVPFVLRRLELDGIDTGTWTPNLAIWRDAAANPGDVA
jgi:hypothetical protein